MSSRAQAALRNLQLRLLESLPFLVALQAPKELLILLLDDFLKYQALETTTKAVETQVAKDIKQGYNTGQSEATTLLREELKRVRNESLEAQEAAEKALDKHYRIASRHLHPDRHGEESRPAFERLTRAKDCLKQTDKRRLYLEQMMQVAQISPSLVEKSHDAWTARNLPHEQHMPSVTKTTGGPLLIKGGIANDIPRKAFVSILNVKKRRVQIEMPVKSNFCQYCVKMHVVAKCADYEKDEVTIGTVHKNAIEDAKHAMDKVGSTITEISVDAVMPISGIWDIAWYAILLINGEKVKTPHSHEGRVDLTSEEQRRRRAAIHSMDELAKQRAGDIQSILCKLRGPRPDHLEIERRCDLLHEVISRGRSTLNRLLDLLRADGVSESTVTGLRPLREALELAGPAKEILESQFEQSSKRDSLKIFKHHVARLLESGEAAAWLRTVGEDDLKALGGETNRLYQLLVEGKVAHHLELDAATLEAAVGRTDLFTPKQCESLESRKKEVEEQVEKEAERALLEAKEKEEREAKEAAELAQIRKKQAEEEKKRKLLEARFEAEREAQLAAIRESQERAKGATVEHPVHSLVEIQGLKTNAGFGLNGTLGTVMYKKGERYVIECQSDGKLRSFLPASLHNLGISAPEYLNPATSSSWNCDLCTYLHEGDRASATMCDMCNNPRNNKSPTSYAATTEASVPVSTAAPKHEEPAKPIVTKPKAPAKPVPEREAALVAKSRQCFHGANCRHIRNGHNECKFYHSPEEIEQAVAKHKGEHTMFIPAVTVGWVIGKGGAHMKEVQQKTRAKVSIDEKKMYPNKTRIVRMSGNQESVNMAMQMIKDLVAEYDDGYGTTYTATQTEPTSLVTVKSEESNDNAVPVARIPKASSPPQPIQPQAAVARVTVAASPPQPIQPPAVVARVPQASSPPQPIQPPKAISPPKRAYLSPPPQFQDPVAKPVENAKKPTAANERTVTLWPTPSDMMLSFLTKHKACLKGSPEAFGTWLASEDIMTLEDLSAAVSDDDYLHEVLQKGDGKVGVKGFKRAAFKSAALSAVNQGMNGDSANGLVNEEEAPAELVCPISHVLMTNDPVLAADGHTYERAAIDAWFRKQQAEVATAKREIAGGNSSQQARAIIDRGVLSPMTHSKMPHLNLTPNHNVRNLARDFASRSKST